jgi:hypothetical protein
VPRWTKIQASPLSSVGADYDQLMLWSVSTPTAVDSFFMIESEPALENVDVMTQATTAVTGFTRFTAAKSATSNVTGASKCV